VQHADNVRVLKLSSDHPVNEPFLELLIHAESSTVNVSRQFTLLVDPPASSLGEETDAPSKAENKPKALARNTEMTEEESVPEYVPRKSRKSSRNQAKKAPVVTHVTDELAANVDVEAESYTTQSGDVFGKIAQRYQPEGIRLKRVMAVFFAANPDAFIDGDMNRLKVGQTLLIPTQESMGVISKEAKELGKPALAAIKEQNTTPKPDANPKFVLKISPGDTEPNSSNITDKPAIDPSTTTSVVNSAPANNGNNAASKPDQAQSADLNAAPVNSQQLSPADVLPIAPPAPPAQAVAKKPMLAQSVVDNSSFIDSLMANLPWIAFGMAISLLSILVVYVLNKRRLAAMQKLQQSIFK
jgi:pilus assembly protein FimV